MKNKITFLFMLCALNVLLILPSYGNDQNKAISSTAQEYIDDTTIVTRIKAIYLTDPIIKTSAIYVGTLNGHVQLAGFVKTSLEKERAFETAKYVKGIKDIHNDIIVIQD